MQNTKPVTYEGCQPIIRRSLKAKTYRQYLKDNAVHLISITDRYGVSQKTKLPIHITLTHDEELINTKLLKLLEGNQ